MYTNNHNAPATGAVVRLLLVCWLALCAAAPARALDSGDIHVVAVRGDVRVAHGGGERPLRAGTVLALPATVRTGRDGSADLRQGRTTVRVAPDSLLEFPAPENPGAPIDRVVQPRGNAFYDVGKRDGRKLRVETPYLVAVIKGTQFNVAVQAEAATISLFEGLLEVRAPDGSSVIDLEAGEIATRRRGGTGIDVLEMDAKTPVRTPAAATGGAREGGSGSPSADGSVPAHSEVAPAPVVEGRGAGRDVADAARGTGLAHGARPAGVDASPGRAPVDAPANLGASAQHGSADVSTTGGLGPAGVAVAASSEPHVPAVRADAAADLVASGAVDRGAATHAAVDARAIAASLEAVASLGATAGADAGVAGGANLDAGAAAVDTGAAAVDTGAGTAVDVGPSAAAVGAGGGIAIDAGGLGTDLAVEGGVDSGGKGGPDVSVAVNVDVASGAGPAVVDVSLSSNLDSAGATPAATVDVDRGPGAHGAGLEVAAAAGTLDLGVSVGAVNVDVGADLGLDDDSETAADGAAQDTTINDGTDVGNIVDDVGGVLDGLLRRPRGK